VIQRLWGRVRLRLGLRLRLRLRLWATPASAEQFATDRLVQGISRHGDVLTTHLVHHLAIGWLLGEKPGDENVVVCVDEIVSKYMGEGKKPLLRVALYTTAEPCPMCQGAVLWSGIGTVVYGTSIRFLQSQGWRQIDILAEEVVRRSPSWECTVIGGVLEQECNALFEAASRRKR